MIFNSIDFAIFLPLAFSLYWLIDRYSQKYQNAFLVGISYFFYGCWDVRFLTLIIASTTVDYWIGLQLNKTPRHFYKKLLLAFSISFNLGMLFYFKYCNFFLDNISNVFSFCGLELQLNSIEIILPVGISFYTFQTMSYTIDIYKGKIKACKDFITFAAFVCYFPQLIAGPIERANNLLPQFNNKRKFQYNEAINGMRQILCGLFKKIVIADNCALVANQVFMHSYDYSGSTLLIGVLFFSIQIYGDFSGYSDIAIGSSKLFGIKLMKNFSFPYFSRNVGEFWRRWHISLSTWFRDYIYIPLGGSQKGMLRQILNTFIIFIICGFWHGANWTFVVWGLINAAYFIPLIILKSNRKHIDTIGNGNLLPSATELIKILCTFILISITWVFFRADNLQHALSYIAEICSPTLFDYPNLAILEMCQPILVYVTFLFVMEWMGREGEFAFENLGKKLPFYLRGPLYYGLTMMIIWYSGKEQQFIYFQF